MDQLEGEEEKRYGAPYYLKNYEAITRNNKKNKRMEASIHITFSAAHLACSQLSLFIVYFGPVDGSNKFLRNINKLLPGKMASHPRRQCSSWSHTWETESYKISLFAVA